MESLTIRSSIGTESNLARAEKGKADYKLQHRLQRPFFLYSILAWNSYRLLETVIFMHFGKIMQLWEYTEMLKAFHWTGCDGELTGWSISSAGLEQHLHVASLARPKTHACWCLVARTTGRAVASLTLLAAHASLCVCNLRCRLRRVTRVSRAISVAQLGRGLPHFFDSYVRTTPDFTFGQLAPRRVLLLHHFENNVYSVYTGFIIPWNVCLYFEFERD